MKSLPRLPRSGFLRLDQAARRAPRGLHGSTLIKDPTLVGVEPEFRSYTVLNSSHNRHMIRFREIDEAYGADSYIQQGVNKYVELCSKHGWGIVSENPDSVQYLKRRFQYMGLMTGKGFRALVRELITDFIKYGSAFWVAKRQRPPEGFPDLPETGAAGSALPIMGYFRVDPKRMTPVWSSDSKQLLGWEYSPPDGKRVVWKRADVVYFPFNVQAGHMWGTAPLGPVLEDVRVYRQCEEYVAKLLYKHLNPMLHHEIPDVTGTGLGRQEDVDAAQAAHSIIAPDGFLITPPGHKLQMIGAESRALRGEGYLRLFLGRLYAGLGVNPAVMGEPDTSSAGSADAMTATMHNRAKYFQICLAELLTDLVLTELLMEGGFDPTSEIDKADWKFDEIETETLLKRENHYLQLYTNNGITEEELRRLTGRKPLTEEDYAGTYVNRVKIPTIKAEAEVRAQNFAGGTPAANDKTSGPDSQSRSRDRPSNQHGPRGGPKIRPR